MVAFWSQQLVLLAVKYTMIFENWQMQFSLVFIFLMLPQDIFFIAFRESVREGGRDRGKERKRQRNIDWLPSCTGD